MRIDQSSLDMLNAGNKKPAKKHKYNAQPKVIDGHKFPSKHEAERYQELKLMEIVGAISDLKIQPKKFILQPGFRHKFQKRKIQQISYTPDFYYLQDGMEIYEDAKGFETEPYKIRKKILLFQNPDINFREYRK